MFHRTVKNFLALLLLSVALPRDISALSRSYYDAGLAQSRLQPAAYETSKVMIVDDNESSSEEGKSVSSKAIAGKDSGTKSGGNPRFLGLLFSSYSPYNPFSRLLVPSSSATSDPLNFLITSRIPQAAIARLVFSGNDNAQVGNALFLQKTAASPMIVLISGENADLTATTTGLVEIRTNPVPSGTGTNRCSDDNLGPIFNPTANAVDGGVITRTATVTATNFMRVYVQDLQPTRASMFAPNSIIGRSVRYSNANAELVCGTIVAL